MKHVQVVQIGKLGYSQEKYGIVASGFSGRHIFSTAKKLAQEVKALECPLIINQPGVKGRKDDPWVLVVVKDVQVHLILDEYRYDLDIEFRWLNEPPAEMIDKYKTYVKLKKNSD
jgi:ribosomal silencing factor RsfS